MAADELVLLAGGKHEFGRGSAPAVARAAGTLLARAAITAVLSVCGSALMLAALAVLDGAPLAVVLAIVAGSWSLAGRVVADLRAR
jgi:hypothetical protein